MSVQFDHFLFVSTFISKEWLVDWLVFHSNVEDDRTDDKDNKIDLEYGNINTMTAMMIWLTVLFF